MKTKFLPPCLFSGREICVFRVKASSGIFFFSLSVVSPWGCCWAVVVLHSGHPCLQQEPGLNAWAWLAIIGGSPFCPLGLSLASAAVLCMDNWYQDFGSIPSRGFAFTGNPNGSIARKKRLPIMKLRGNMHNSSASIFELKYSIRSQSKDRFIKDTVLSKATNLIISADFHREKKHVSRYEVPPLGSILLPQHQGSDALRLSSKDRFLP